MSNPSSTIIVDSFGDQALVDPTGNLQVGREDITNSAPLNQVSDVIIVPVNGASSMVFNFSGTFTASLAIQGTADNINTSVSPTWFGLNAFGTAATGTATPAPITVFFGSAGYVMVNTGGLFAIRIRCVAFIAGPIFVTWTVGVGLSNILQVCNPTASNFQVLTGCSNLFVTATGAAAAAVTATLPSDPVLVHRITSLEIEAYTTAARTGGTTPVLVTSTNLPGSPVWTFSTGAAVGTTDTKLYTFPYALQASASNTATTIVCPATTSVIWRVNIAYYLL